MMKTLKYVFLLMGAVWLFPWSDDSWAQLPLEKSDDVPCLVGLKVHSDNPLVFNFIVDRGTGGQSEAQLKHQTEQLVKYFLTALTLPDEDVWVNLSPTEKNRIIPERLSHTAMGEVMLAQDLELKKWAASLTDPQTPLGKKYWQNAQDTISKVWILPGKAEVIEHPGGVMIKETALKVMIEDDLSSQAFKIDILPQIEAMVNTHKDFASIRQVYHSVILAAWFKQALKKSLLGQVYADQKKMGGITIAKQNIKEEIYERYLTAIRKGAYQYIGEVEDTTTGELVPQKYFSGGVHFFGKAMERVLIRRTGQDQDFSSLKSSSAVNAWMDYQIRLAENPQEYQYASSAVEQSDSRAGENVVSLARLLEIRKKAFAIYIVLRKMDSFYEDWWVRNERIARRVLEYVLEAMVSEAQQGTTFDVRHSRMLEPEKVRVIIDRLARHNYWGESLNPQYHPELQFSTLLVERVLKPFHEILRHLTLGKVNFDLSAQTYQSQSIHPQTWAMLVTAVNEIMDPGLAQDAKSVVIDPKLANVLRAFKLQVLKIYPDASHIKSGNMIRVSRSDFSELASQYDLNDEAIDRYLYLMGFQIYGDRFGTSLTYQGFQEQAIFYKAQDDIFENVVFVLALVIPELRKSLEKGIASDRELVTRLTRAIAIHFQSGEWSLDRPLKSTEAREIAQRALQFLGVEVGDFDRVRFDKPVSEFEAFLEAQQIVISSSPVLEFSPAHDKRVIVRKLLSKLRDGDIRGRQAANLEAVQGWWADAKNKRLAEVYLQKIFDGLLAARQNPQESLLRYQKIPQHIVQHAVLSLIREGHIPDPLTAQYKKTLGEHGIETLQIKLSLPAIDNLLLHLGLGTIQWIDRDQDTNITDMLDYPADELYRALNAWQPIQISSADINPELKSKIKQLTALLIKAMGQKDFGETIKVFVFNEQEIAKLTYAVDLSTDTTRRYLKLLGFTTNDQESFAVRREDFQAMSSYLADEEKFYNLISQVFNQVLNHYSADASSEIFRPIYQANVPENMVHQILMFIGLESQIPGEYRYPKGYRHLEENFYLAKIVIPSASSSVGGINFNMSPLFFQIQRDKGGVALSVAEQKINDIQIEGLYPVILTATPFNLQSWLQPAK